jgi:precorrin-8X/cobalt-precorrin-8 methylmutase
VISLEYERDGAAIYRQSFATIRAEADLTGVPADLEPVVVRMIHACGDVGIVPLVDASDGFVSAAGAALRAGRPIWCDAEMVAHGVTRSRLPAGNDVHCSVRDPDVAQRALTDNTTRSAAAVDASLGVLDGALAVVGNAPTALFRLIELMLEGRARPAAVIGIPVGFVGAAESKQALVECSPGVPYLTVHGRRGGSAMAAAAVNAVASPKE